jgi:hypothetical protein
MNRPDPGSDICSCTGIIGIHIVVEVQLEMNGRIFNRVPIVKYNVNAAGECKISEDI